MIIKTLFILPMVLMNCSRLPQDPILAGIDSVCVYTVIEERGFTTAGAYSNFDDLRNQKVEKHCISLDKKSRLQQIINEAKKVKHFQRKLSGGLVFCEMQFANQSQISRVVISIGSESSGIMDLTNRIDFIVSNQSDMEWLRELKDDIHQ